MAAIKIELSGFREVEAGLAKLPIEMRGKTLTSGLRTAAKKVAKLAKALAPIGDDEDARHVRDSITVAVKECNVGLIAIVGGRRPDGNAANVIEGASDKHPGGVDVRHFSHGKPTGKTITGRGSGGILPKQPFILPAGEQLTPGIIGDLQAAVDRAVMRVMS